MDSTLSMVPPRRPARVAMAFLMAAATVGCGEPDATEGADATPVPVRLHLVERIDRPVRVGLSGDVEALRTVSVGFLVPGLVASVGPEEGDRVARGEELAALDPTEYELNAELAAAQRQRAEDEFRRAEAVFNENGIAENDFQKAQTVLRMARVQEAMATKKLADTRITSPLDGIVARRGIERGEQAGPGLPVFTIVSVDPVLVKIGIPESEISSIAARQRAEVTVPALGGAAFEGRVRLVGIAADPASRTYTVKVEVANPNLRLRPGMIAEVQVETDARVQALMVPAEAIVRGADGITVVYVYFAEEQRVHARRVEVGSAYGMEIEIREGLSGDERVVIGGQHRLREGSPVEVVSSSGDVAGAGGEAR